MTEKRGRGRPRREGADEEILGVARALLAERGYRDLTVDEIAERAGVAKTTIYRRWPSKGALMSALIPPAGTYANADAVLRDVRTLLTPLADADDAEVMSVIREILRSRRPALIEFVRDESRADELLGAIWVRLMVSERRRPAG